MEVYYNSPHYYDESLDKPFNIAITAKQRLEFDVAKENKRIEAIENFIANCNVAIAAAELDIKKIIKIKLELEEAIGKL